MLDDNLPEWAKENLGCTLIATFGTEQSKSAVLDACRGYRSADYPDGIEVDEAQYMSSLIPSERGFVWPIHDVVYGNPDKDRKPVRDFVNEVNKYPGLLDIMLNVEGLITHRGSHASGVILFENNPFMKTAFMKTPKGEIITQFDLHDVSYCGAVKYDFLVTDVQDKLVQTIKFLQEDGLLDKNKSLREIYDENFHPNVLPLDYEPAWRALQEGTVLNAFQFDSAVGAQAAKRIKPKTLQEMSDANGSRLARTHFSDSSSGLD